MINAIIIEDEKASLELLLQSLAAADQEIRVEAILSSVKDAKAYFSKPVTADIIFSDIQLTDGHSFEIFLETDIHIPVIFITGFNDFMVNAFSCNGIDYLLKPVQEKDIRNAISKYRMLENHFSLQSDRLHTLIRQMDARKRTRMIVRRGLSFVALRIEDVVLIYTEDKLVYVTDNTGKKYIAGKTMSDMESELDNAQFFRANRQYIVNVAYIRGFKPYEKVKLALDMELPDTRHEIIISQENASQFRQWMYQA